MSQTDENELLAMALQSLYRSKVIGFNDDGSVWVYGGFAESGTLNYTYGGAHAVAPVWRKGEQYATADSPLAAALRQVLEGRAVRNSGLVRQVLDADESAR